MEKAFLGLGSMGFFMAGHLAEKAAGLTVYNRSLAKAEAWAKRFSGTIAETPAEASRAKEMVFLCVSRDQDVREVITGPEGVLQTLPQGGVVVDHSTTSAELAKEMAAACAAKGIAFLDAPVSGGTVGAEKGSLTIMVGGEKAAFDRAAKIFSAYAKFSSYMGPSGSGQFAKMANQILILGVVQSLAEGVSFAEKSGLDLGTWIETVKHGASQSWQLENRAATMHQRRFDFGFAVELMSKDIGIVKNAAAKLGANLPLVEIVDSFYNQLQQQGKGRLDTSSLILLLDSLSHV